MKKQINVQSIDIENLNMASAIEGICQSNGIVFITEQRKLIGAISEGDIRRYIKSGYHILDKTMFNHEINYITECNNMCDIYSKADKIFREYPKVYNIPVVDEKMTLLYEIDRVDNVIFEHIKESLFKIKKYKPINILLECHKSSNILLTGGNLEILDLVRNCLSRELKECRRNINIEISDIVNITQFRDYPEDTIIICISDIIINYLRKIFCNTKLIISIKEIPDYYFYKKLDDIKLETITNFINLFGYEKILICNRNKYINKIISGIKKNKISVIDKSENNNNLCLTDVYAYSVHEQYKERISLEKFSTILQTIQEYNYVAKVPLSKEKYIQEYLNCLEEFRNNGIKGIIFKIYNLLDYEVLKVIKRLKCFYVIEPEEEKNVFVKWLDVTKEPGGGDGISLELGYWCIQTALVNVSYDLVCKYCNNVYAYRIPWDMGKYDKYYNMERIIENYNENNKYFPPNFVEIMYGKEDFPVKRLLKDLQECTVVYINDGYMKYQSNYISEFFNTDTYGNRITKHAPKVYNGTIWLIGTCIFSGYAVPDCDTVASILQKKINKFRNKLQSSKS